MFGRKAREITAQQQEIDMLKQENATLRGEDLIGGIATRIAASIDAMQGEDGEPVTGSALDARVTELMQVEEAALIEQRAHRLAPSRLAALLGTEQARLEAAAGTRAAAIAAASLASLQRQLNDFLEGGDAGAHRQTMAAKLAADPTGEVLAAAREEIRREELAKATAWRKARLDEAEAADRALLPRAEAIRERAETTRMVGLEQLTAGDLLTIYFAHERHAFNQSLVGPHVQRTVQATLLDKEANLFEIRYDSFFDKGTTRAGAMWGGSQRHLAADDPTTTEVREVPAIVQGKQLAFTTPESDAVDVAPLVVAAVKLGSHPIIGNPPPY